MMKLRSNNNNTTDDYHHATTSGDQKEKDKVFYEYENEEIEKEEADKTEEEEEEEEERNNLKKRLAAGLVREKRALRAFIIEYLIKIVILCLAFVAFSLNTNWISLIWYMVIFLLVFQNEIKKYIIFQLRFVFHNSFTCQLYQSFIFTTVLYHEKMMNDALILTIS